MACSMWHATHSHHSCVLFCLSVCLCVYVVRRVDTVVLVALAVGAVTDRLTLSRDESKVLEFIENIRNKQERKIAAAKMLQHGWRAYYTQRGKKDAQSLHDPMGVPENSILSEPLFYKAALQYAQMRSESVNGFYHTHTHTHARTHTHTHTQMRSESVNGFYFSETNASLSAPASPPSFSPQVIRRDVVCVCASRYLH